MALPPHLLLLPGLHGTTELWGPLLAELPQGAAFTMVSYPPDQVLSRAQLLELIERAMPSEGELVVIAESFSGPLAVEFAARHAQRVRALVLAVSFIRPPWPARVILGVAWVARHFMRPLMTARGWLPDRWADATVGRASRDALRHLTPQVLASRLRLVAQCEARQQLARCRMPLVYLQASRDIVIRPGCLRSILRVRPDARVTVLDCSHMILQRRPRQAWEAIAAAL